MSRYSAENEAMPVVRYAVRQSRGGDMRDLASGAMIGTSGLPVTGSITRTNDDGAVVHDFMLGVDTLGDATAILRSSGTHYNYGN